MVFFSRTRGTFFNLTHTSQRLLDKTLDPLTNCDAVKSLIFDLVNKKVILKSSVVYDIINIYTSPWVESYNSCRWLCRCRLYYCLFLTHFKGGTLITIDVIYIVYSFYLSEISPGRNIWVLLFVPFVAPWQGSLERQRSKSFTLTILDCRTNKSQSDSNLFSSFYPFSGLILRSDWKENFSSDNS